MAMQRRGDSMASATVALCRRAQRRRRCAVPADCHLLARKLLKEVANFYDAMEAADEEPAAPTSSALPQQGRAPVSTAAEGFTSVHAYDTRCARTARQLSGLDYLQLVIAENTLGVCAVAYAGETKYGNHELRRWAHDVHRAAEEAWLA
eukprot:1401481-Pleurochrysis_carterae.AAC.2